MSFKNNLIIVTSTSKAVKQAKVTGKLNTKEIFSFKLLDYLLAFIDETIDNGSILYKDTKEDLLLFMSEFRYNNPKDICNYKVTTNINNPTIKDPSTINTAPTVLAATIDMTTALTYTFKVSDFTTSFSDAQGDRWKNLIIYPADVNGTLTYNGVEKTAAFTIKVEDVINLIYTRVDDTAFSEVIKFRISDDNIHSLYSSIISNSLTGTLVTSGNQPAVIGDNTIYVDNRVVTVLTLDMFTSQLQPPYNDPEGDLIDAIRIDTISEANLGTFYYNSIEIVEGLILSRENLETNLFTHSGPDQDTISSDVFTFSARDEGSQIWVQ